VSERFDDFMMSRWFVVAIVGLVAVLCGLVMGAVIHFGTGCPKGEHEVITGYYPLLVGKVVVQQPIIACQAK
jgi:hypothetical protein